MLTSRNFSSKFRSTHNIMRSIIIAGCAIATLAACSSETDTNAVTTTTESMTTTTSTAPRTTTTPVPITTTTTSSPVAEPPVATPAAAPAVMPNVVCTNLQDAQDRIQAAGVFFSRSADATGAGRNQVLDSNWIVVSQSPAAGSEVNELEAVLSVVKIGEPNPC
ncbi:UNVERIFIED_ORG: PASTA domain-containing protein [Nocardia globerula]|uniref:PASTA domain-containing protein n=2 Tax=Nocardiaceae TaxID=85025 RepID=A0A652YQY5_NOCGL|nr:PASTA domain-containing protein [Nocardia globerula]PVX62998.1 PASTA domain-containing protein [Rhodococcus globerulus]